MGENFEDTSVPALGGAAAARLRSSGLQLLILAFIGLSGASISASAADSCTTCHDQGQKLAKSAHSSLSCDSCHVQHETYPHPPKIAKPVCIDCHSQQGTDYEQSVHGQAAKKGGAAPDCALCHGSAHELLNTKVAAFRESVIDTCAMCHDNVVGQYRKSVHGKALAAGIMQAPLCTDCHGEHRILAHSNENSTVSAGHIRDTCGNCHGNVTLSGKFGLPTDRLMSFDASFHGLAAKAGNETVANCASCHGVHNILPSNDPQSSIHPKNLAKTCGKCHDGAGERFAITPVHLVDGHAEAPPVRMVREFYLLVIPFTIGLMLLHNGGDWLRKLITRRFLGRGTRLLHTRTPGRPREIRMLPFERLQHAILVISFVALVWTGFALKYPSQWWARPLLLWEGHTPVREIAHRVAACVFIAVSVTHLVSLIVSRRLRDHWKDMWPKASDMTEAAANMSFNVGIRKIQPSRSAHSYIEKAEYWAVVWGAIVMAVSGIMLWANNLMLRLLPKTWLDIATSVHFYEAVLATLAIIVWHLYSVIFDPDVYPLDTAWLTGVSVKEHEQEHE
ncbi:MAG TPA: cytochrome b/b6 domain-containing protein [Bryobacteraceae bacterium]|jgi:cytochrome b subunit of formate dehydrogenase